MSMNSLARLFLLVAAAIAASAASYTQSLSWSSISGVPGCITVREAADGKLFSASDGSTYFNAVLYSSVDDGQSWFQTAISYGWILEVVPNGRNIIVSRALANGRFNYQAFFSTDNGDTWKGILANDIFQAPYSGFMSSDSGVIYAVAGGGGNSQLVKLNGQRWDFIGTQFPPGSFTFNAVIPIPTAIDHQDRIYAGTTSSGLYMTSDFGTTWRQTLPGLKVTAVKVKSGILVAGTSPNSTRNGGVFVSADTGNSWTFLGLAEQNINSVTIGKAGEIFATTSTGVYRYGGTPNVWDNLSPSPEPFGGVEVTTSNVFLAASIAKGIFRSTDAGASWERSGIPSEDIGSLLLTSGGYVVAGSYGNRVFVTNNNGGTWGQTNPGTICDIIYSLVEKSPLMYAGTDCGIFSSPDAGKTWTNVSQSQIAGGIFALARDSVGTLFSGTNFGIYRSTDNGGTWTSSGLAGYKISGIAVNSANSIFALTALNGIFSSSDAGTTWSSAGLVRPDLQSIAVNTNNKVFVGGNGGVYTLADTQSTWAYTPVVNAYIYSLAFRDANTVIAGTGSGVYVSLSEGASWVQRNSGLTVPTILSVGVDASGYVYAGALHGGVSKSTDVLTGVKEERALPSAFGLVRNYPNPFNPSTSIEFRVAHTGLTTVEVFNIMGDKVATLVNEIKMPGEYRVRWDASMSPSGVYVCRMRSGSVAGTVKLLLLR